VILEECPFSSAKSGAAPLAACWVARCVSTGLLAGFKPHGKSAALAQNSRLQAQVTE
jgi:hypothetical protein